jgi:hypothetical protein
MKCDGLSLPAVGLITKRDRVPTHIAEKVNGFRVAVFLRVCIEA